MAKPGRNHHLMSGPCGNTTYSSDFAIRSCTFESLLKYKRGKEKWKGGKIKQVGIYS